MKKHETLPAAIERDIERLLKRIRETGEGIDDKIVTRNYRRAYAKYQAAVMGDTTFLPEVGAPIGYITETYVKKEAWRRYAEERGMELE